VREPSNRLPRRGELGPKEGPRHAKFVPRSGGRPTGGPANIRVRPLRRTLHGPAGSLPAGRCLMPMRRGAFLGGGSAPSVRGGGVRRRRPGGPNVGPRIAYGPNPPPTASHHPVAGHCCVMAPAPPPPPNSSAPSAKSPAAAFPAAKRYRA